MSTFDTLHAAKTLAQAGFAPPQAEAITDTIRAAFTDSVATKADIAELRADMAALRTELKGDIAELRTELKGDIAELRTELKGDIAELRTELKGDMAELRTDMAGLRTEIQAVELRMAERFEALYKHLWLGAVGIVATIAAIVRLLSG